MVEWEIMGLVKKIDKLAGVNLNRPLREISKESGIAKSTVDRLLKNSSELQSLREAQKQALIQLWHNKAIENMKESADIEPKSRSEAITAAAIATDKIIALENPPNQGNTKINIGDNRTMQVNVHKSLKGLLKE